MEVELMQSKNCQEIDQLEDLKSVETKDRNNYNNGKVNIAKLNNSNSTKSVPTNNLVLANSTSGVTDGGTEDCEMKNIDDYEPESSAITTPISSSDLEQTPRSSSEVEGGDGERSEKSENIPNNLSKSTINSIQVTNGPAHHVAPNITKRSVTLQMLLAAGILKPGVGTMSLEYHGQKFMGDLLENGIIRSQETSQEFSSPSAWATACKQIINPDKNQRKSGCGWAAIKHRNLKLDYYKTVWFKRLREGSIDLKHISNGAGASSSSSDSEDEDTQVCVLKYGEHLEKSPSYQSAEQLGAKVLISCTEFQAIDRLQPFHVKISDQALAFADLHSNIISAECVGYISGQWNAEQNCLNMETVHPCRILMPHSSSTECDMERNRIAVDIQKLGHDVVGWYHSHPKAPPHPSKDDIGRQLEYQVMMKGASESSYIPCVGVIISPACYNSIENSKKSPVQLFWVMPPPENRPLEMGQPMKIEYENYPGENFDHSKMLFDVVSLLNFYKEKKSLIDVNDLAGGKFEKLKETLCSSVPQLSNNSEFWNDLRQMFLSPLPVPLPQPAVKAEEPPDPINAIENSDDPSISALNHNKASSSGAGSSPHSPERAKETSSPGLTIAQEEDGKCSSSNSVDSPSDDNGHEMKMTEPQPMEIT